MQKQTHLINFDGCQNVSGVSSRHQTITVFIEYDVMIFRTALGSSLFFIFFNIIKQCIYSNINCSALLNETLHCTSFSLFFDSLLPTEARKYPDSIISLKNCFVGQLKNRGLVLYSVASTGLFSPLMQYTKSFDFISDSPT